MNVITLILKTLYDMCNGLYEIFKFLIDFPGIISNVMIALPPQVVSLSSAIFLVAIVVIFLKILL